MDVGRAMSEGALPSVMRQSDGRTFEFTFTDGAEMTAVVVSDSHVDADDTLILLRVGAASGGPGWQVHLDEIAKVTAVGGSVLYSRHD